MSVMLPAAVSAAANMPAASNARRGSVCRYASTTSPFTGRLLRSIMLKYPRE